MKAVPAGARTQFAHIQRETSSTVNSSGQQVAVWNHHCNVMGALVSADANSQSKWAGYKMNDTLTHTFICPFVAGLKATDRLTITDQRHGQRMFNFAGPPLDWEGAAVELHIPLSEVV